MAEMRMRTTVPTTYLLTSRVDTRSEPVEHGRFTSLIELEYFLDDLLHGDNFSKSDFTVTTIDTTPSSYYENKQNAVEVFGAH